MAIKRCATCGAYDDDLEIGSCVTMESGDGNTASPSGAYPVYSNMGHVWVDTDEHKEEE